MPVYRSLLWRPWLSAESGRCQYLLQQTKVCIFFLKIAHQLNIIIIINDDESQQQQCCMMSTDDYILRTTAYYFRFRAIFAVLFILMGVCWIKEVISFAVGGSALFVDSYRHSQHILKAVFCLYHLCLQAKRVVTTDEMASQLAEIRSFVSNLYEIRQRPSRERRSILFRFTTNNYLMTLLL